MINPAVRNEHIKKLRELMNGIPVAMVTSMDDETQQMRTRPMPVQRKPFEGTLFFFGKLKPTAEGETRDVMVSLSNEDKNLYIAVAGKGTVSRNLEMMEELWHSGLNQWFPKGLGDPDLVLMQVEVEHAEYWDGPDNAVQRLAGFVKAVATRAPYRGPENEQLAFS